MCVARGLECNTDVDSPVCHSEPLMRCNLRRCGTVISDLPIRKLGGAWPSFSVVLREMHARGDARLTVMSCATKLDTRFVCH